MKTTRIIPSLIMAVCMTVLSGQAQSGFNYQAVARNANGELLKNTVIDVSFTIRTASESGTIQWIEEHAVTTDQLGSFSMIIGAHPEQRTGGAVTVFSDIDWSAANHFLQVHVDGTDLGTHQIMSVPYALVAENVINIPTGAWMSEGEFVYLDQGNVGIGVSNPASRLAVQGDPNSDIDTALFEVLNIYGEPVFAVYNEGVRIYIEDSGVKGIKGGFAVGGYNSGKAGVSTEYLRITPDSARIWVNEPDAKGIKGGFAVGGYTSGKSSASSYLQLDPENYFIGHEAGISNTTGLYNSFIGYQAGTNNISGSQNIFVGYKSGFSNTDGNINSFLGNHAGYNNTSGHENVFIGDSSGFSNTTGFWNVFVGERTGKNNETGRSNVFIGDKAGQDNLSGDRNVFLGSIAGWKNIDGRMNVFVGSSVGASNISGSYNTFLGNYSGRTNTTGHNNVFIGTAAGYSNSTGSDNIYLGNGAGSNTDTTFSNIFIGNNSGQNNTGGVANVFLGNRTGAENIIGSNNTILGHESGHYTGSGNLNTLVGAYAGHFLESGSQNTIIGMNAGANTGAGFRNTYVGQDAGYHSTGSDNVFIGKSAGFNEQGSNKLYIHNNEADSSWALIYGDFARQVLTTNGKMGINTTNPWNELQVSSYGATAKIMVGERDSIQGNLELAGSKSGIYGGTMTFGTSADFKTLEAFWRIGVTEDDFNIGSQSNTWFTILQDGTILHRGSELHADHVFTGDYTLESIEAHAALMWENGHLPAVPAAMTDENGRDIVNLGARNKGVLEELEKAHIYIEQLNTAIQQQQAMITELKIEIEKMKSVQ